MLVGLNVVAMHMGTISCIRNCMGKGIKEAHIISIISYASYR